MKRSILMITVLLNIVMSFSQEKTEDLLKQLGKTVDKEKKLAVLDDLTINLVKANDNRQSIYLKNYIALAQDLGEFDLAVEKSRFLIEHYTSKGQLDSTLYTIERMLIDKPKYKKESSEAHLLLKRASYYYNKNQLENASQDYKKAGDMFLKSGDSIFAADARYFDGQVQTDLNKFVTGVERFKEAYKLYSDLGDEEYSNYTIAELATLYGRNDFNDKAIKERKKILKYFKNKKEYLGIAYTYPQIGFSYFKKGAYEKSKKYLDSLSMVMDSIPELHHKEQLQVQLLKSRINHNLVDNNLEEAQKNLTTALEKVNTSNFYKYYESSFLLQQAELYNRLNQPLQAEVILKRFFEITKGEGDFKMIKKAEKEMSKVYVSKGDYKKAFEHVSNYIEKEEQKNKALASNTFLYYQSEFETERKDNEIFKNETEIALLEKDKEIAVGKRKVLWTIILAVILLSILISYYIWKEGKQKRVALVAKIERNKKELEDYTRQLLDKSRTQEELVKEVEKLKQEIGNQKSFEKLQDLTAAKILTNEDWYAFKQKFTNVYPNFFIGLKKKGYELTKAEERLLAMEKLYLDTGQIASMLAISQDSVTKSRSRLRKKINAPKGSSILKYLEAV